MGKSIFYNIRRKCQLIAADILSKETMSKLYFKIVLGEKLNLDNPQTFNEKVQWLKLYEWPNNALAVKCADKYAVREYVKQCGYEELLNDLYGVWDNADDIDWAKLPDQFVLKCNHGCGYNIICPDKSKLDEKATKKQLNKWLKEDFGKFNIEPHYSKIKPKVICEKFLGGNMIDYKFYFFDGEYQFMYIAQGFGEGINESVSFFDKDGKKAAFRRTDYPEFSNAELPQQYENMLKISQKFADDFPFVRVDLFENNGKIYFSELTFTPCGGMMKISPKEYDLAIGKKLNILVK